MPPKENKSQSKDFFHKGQEDSDGAQNGDWDEDFNLSVSMYGGGLVSGA